MNDSFEANIFNKYSKYIIYIAIFITLILLLFLFNHLFLKKKLIKIIQENEKQNEILIHQTKMASLGEMINVIAHQWKQPLAELSFINIYLKEKIKEKIIQDKIIRTEVLIKYMSETIETFQKFYTQLDDRVAFNLKDAISESFILTKSNINTNNVKILCKLPKNIFLIGSKNEFLQVILSIFQNSIFIFNKEKINCPKITINAKEINEIIILIISDNAGGISTKPIESVFNPFFTTNPKKSSGIGLYMAKKIINEKFKGQIKVKNYFKGIKITIIIKKIN